MRTVVRIAALTTCLLAFGSIHSANAQENGTAKDEDVLVLHFEPLKYPTPAAARHIQGAVVVQATLDKDGAVTEATAISSESSDLSVPAVNNVKKWIFQPNGHKTAIVVYSFIILDGRCELHSSLFVLQGKNLATVISCPPNVNP
jgi:TonB family protein